MNSSMALETEHLFLLQLAEETYSTIQNISLFLEWEVSS
jgi:hypothetical protein